jgi:hypothetical protein
MPKERMVSGVSPAAGLKSGGRAEQRTAEYRITNIEVWNRCAPSFYKNSWIQSFDIRHSLFDIRYSLF